jgi:peptidoglycan/LPS O-acetylase OafA/YrhL
MASADHDGATAAERAAAGPVPVTISDSLRHMLALDGLRGIAIILVLFHNLTMTGEAKAPLVADCLEAGWVGVQLFLVLSGFLITRNLLATDLSTPALKAFLIRRCLRVVPVCYLMLAIYFLIVPRLFVVPTIEATRHTQIWYWLFLSNWTEPFGVGAPGLGHLWSLGVEMQFYLVWPFVIRAIGTRRIAHACVVMIVAALTFSIMLRYVGGTPMAVYKFTITRMNALATGALVAVVAMRPDLRIPVRALAGGTAAALLGVVVWRGSFDYADPVVGTVGYVLIATLFGLWLLPIARSTSAPDDPARRNPAVTIPSARWLCSVGRVSYGMYVVHYPLHWFGLQVTYPRMLGKDGVIVEWKLAVYVVLASFATYLLARVLWFALERPILNLKRHVPATGFRRPTLPLETLSSRGLLDRR